MGCSPSCCTSWRLSSSRFFLCCSWAGCSPTADTAVEIGDWHRLTGRSIGAYLGLVPTEHSSGSTRSHGGITKTGNGHARRLLVEAARHHRPRYRPGRNLRRRWDAAPLAARTRGEAANQRLHARWAGLDHRRKHPVVANAAIARERAGLVLVVGRPRRLTRPINARMMTRGCRQAPGSDPRATYEQSHCGAIDYARPLDKRSTPIRKFRPVVPTRAYPNVILNEPTGSLCAFLRLRGLSLYCDQSAPRGPADLA